MARARFLLANGATATGAQTRSAVQLPSTMAPVQPINGLGNIILTGTGAISATVLIEGSLNDSAWSTSATLVLSGTNIVYYPYTDVLPFPYVRANVSAISGTGAAVTVTFEYDPIWQ